MNLKYLFTLTRMYGSIFWRGFACNTALFFVKFIMSPLFFSVNFRGLEDVATVINTSKPTTKSGAKKLNKYSLLDKTCTKVLYLLLV